MAPLAADYLTEKRGPELQVPDLAKANTTIYFGSIVNRDSTTGLIEPATDGASKAFAGWSRTHITANGGSDTPEIVLEQAQDRVLDTSESLSQASIGTAVYAVDDHTVAFVATTSNDVRVGTIVAPFISATKCWVRPVGAV